VSITRLGSEYSDFGAHLRPAGNHAPSDIVIPATSEFAIICLAFFEGTTGQHPTTMSLNGQTASLIVAQDDSTAFYQGALYYAPTPSSGTVVLSWDNPVDFDDGVSVRVAFYTGGDITSGAASLVRDSDHAGNSSNAITPTMDGQSGDYTIMGYMSDSATPTFTNGASFNQSTAGATSGLAEYSPTGNHTMNCNGGASTTPGIVAAVLKPAGGGGGQPMLARGVGRRFFFRGVRR
jgi:hypothetical protein